MLVVWLVELGMMGKPTDPDFSLVCSSVHFHSYAQCRIKKGDDIMMKFEFDLVHESVEFLVHLLWVEISESDTLDERRKYSFAERMKDGK